MNFFKKLFSNNSVTVSDISGDSIVTMRNFNSRGDVVAGRNIISVNGNNISVSGSGNVVVRNGKVFVDGKDVTPGDTKEISIVVNGDTDKISVDYCNSFSVVGNVNDLQSTSGNVMVRGAIQGNLQTTSGDVQAYGNVGGSVQTVSGDVECHQVAGSVKTVSGDIKNKK